MSENEPKIERFTLRKGEKLRHRRLVEDLFKEGNSIYEFPLRVAWRKISKEELDNSFRNGTPERIDNLQMLITVPKKRRRHAVDRVLMRRRIREAYRLNRLQLKKMVENIPDLGTLSIAFIYISDQNLPYDFVASKMKKILARLEKKIL